MPLVRRLFLDLPVSRKLVALLWLFVLLVIGLLGLSYFTIESLSAIRAYVGGEGLWSKAEKQATHDLLRYSVSHSEQDYENYERALLVPLGDRMGRLELEKRSPNLTIVRKGFLQGRLSPDDIESQIRLYRNFRHSGHMAEAVNIWAQGDVLIEQLQSLGNQLHGEIQSSNPDAHKVIQLARQVDLVDSELTPLEEKFSAQLGAAARQTKTIFLFVTFAATGGSLLAGLLFTVFLSKHVRESEERYRHLVNSANDAILVLDAQTGIILEANEQSSQLLGLRVREMIGAYAEQFVSPGDRDEYRTLLWRAAEGTPVSAKQLQLLGPDSTSISVEVNASSTEFGGKKIVQGIFRDITERQRLEQEVRQAQKMEVIGRLAGGIAHDFNNLLMVILTQVSKLRDVPTRTQLLRRAETIRAAAERAASLTKQLLAFGRKQVLDVQVLNLNDLLNEVKEMLATIPSNQVQLVLAPDANPLPVAVDAGKIEQVIMNLAVNAIDAMPLGGKLTITTSGVIKQPDKRDGPSMAYAVLEVSDTGCGMSAKTKAHLFEPFFTTKPSGKGTGLGLSTAYGIIKQSGGIIEVESELGRGTTFRVFLPSAGEPTKTRSKTTTESGYGRGSGTVLLAEDQESIRSVLREALEASGYQVLDAKDGRQALELAERHAGTIDVLVTDIVMPQMRGFDLAKQLAERQPDICVIFMSGYSEEVLLEKHLLNQTNVIFIQKPFDPEDLPRKVRECLTRRIPHGTSP